MNRAFEQGQPAAVVFKARGIPIGHCTREGMEVMDRMFERLRGLLSIGLVSGDPSVMVLEAEIFIFF